MHGPSALGDFDALLRAEIRAFRRTWTVGAIFLALLLAALTGLSYAVLPARKAQETAGLTLLGVPVIIGFLFTGLRDPSRHAGLAALRTRAAHVVWIYVRLYHGSARLDEIVFACDDGTEAAIPVDPARSLALLERSAAVFPEATLGYSPEAADTFLRSPPALRRRPTGPVALAQPSFGDTLWLLPHAARSLAMRRFGGALGVVLVVLGGAVMGIVAVAASPRDQPELLITLFAVLIVLPGLLFAVYGLMPFERTALARALRSPARRLRSVQYSHQANRRGDPVPVAIVTLVSGRVFVFGIPARPAPARRA